MAVKQYENQIDKMKYITTYREPFGKKEENMKFVQLIL